MTRIKRQLGRAERSSVAAAPHALRLAKDDTKYKTLEPFIV